ncbi:MAG: RHS repeat-associated core domain-containing protein [Caldilineaceae bacterium]
MIVSLLLLQCTPPALLAAPLPTPATQEVPPATAETPTLWPEFPSPEVAPTTPTDVVEAPPSVDEAPKSLAIALQLAVDAPVLMPETTTTVTVTLQAEAALATDKGSITLTLPKAVISTTGEKNKITWALPALAAGESWQQRVQLQIDKPNQALKRGVDEVIATVDAPSYQPIATSTLLAFAPTLPTSEDTQDETGALIGSSDGDILLLAQPTAAESGVLFRYTELYNWETDGSTSAPTATSSPTATLPAPAAESTAAFPLPLSAVLTITPTDLPVLETVTDTVTDTVSSTETEPVTTTLALTPTTAGQVYLPVVADGTAETATPAQSEARRTNETPMAQPAAIPTDKPTVRTDHNVDAYRLWQLDATQGGDQVEALGGEVLVQVSIKKLVKAGVDPASLALWTREGEEGRWTPVPTVYDAKHARLQAWLPHFSQFGLGAGLQQSGDMLPSVKAFTVDQLNGGAVVNIGLETPKGLGGMSPNLSLSYSSITLDDLYREAGSTEIEAQAGAAGIGWHLGGVSYIARVDTKYDDDNPDTEKKFALVLNGAQGAARVGIAWQDGRWRANPELFAKIEWDSSSSGTGNPQYKAYDFGGWTVWTGDGTKYEFGDTGPFSTAFSSSSATGFGLENTYGGQTFRLAKRWYLRKVTDTVGNVMHYFYQGEQGWERGCVDNSWESDNQHWYTRTIDPTAIYWSANENQGFAHTLRVLFGYTSRIDTVIVGSGDNDCKQPLYGSNNRLTTVTLQVLSGGAWQTMRSYSLGQNTHTFSGNKPRLYLNTIDHLGKDGSLLQRYSFTYHLYNPNHVLLATAGSSFGGSVTYNYTLHRTSCSNSTCPHTMNRYAVTQQITSDGVGNNRYVNHYYGPTNQAGGEWSAVANDGGFLGYQEVQSTSYSLGLGSIIQWEKLESFSSGASADRENPDPRRGKLKRRELRNASGGTVYQVDVYDWKAYWLENNAWQSSPTTTSWKWVGNDPVYPITWVKLEKETHTVGGAVNEQRYIYEPSYGNQTQVAEWADGSLQRTTVTEFFPNSSAWIINKPARVRILDGSGVCRADMRTVYDSAGSGYYNVAPTQGLPRRYQQALTGCGDGIAGIADVNNDWHVTYMEYDGYGNQTLVTERGNTASQDVTLNTNYDATYHLFPIEQWYAASTLHKETAVYYGVNGLALSDSKAFWGALQEHCGVNEVCTRQSYDKFGRPVYRGEAVTKDSGWSSTSNAHVNWSYTPYGNGHSANIVTEWRNPRAEGNFVRKLYNGLGELIQEQRPYQNWAATSGAQEVMVDYLYDARGRQTRVGIPWLTGKYSSGDLRRSAYWGGGYTQTDYDAIGRPTWVTAPNGEQQQYNYAGRAMSIVGFGRNGDPNKMLKWQESDGLGNLKYVRTYNPNGSSWTMDGQVTLSHDVLGNLTSVSHPTGHTTTIGYDLGGRKTSMNDPDLGYWTYGYDRQGKLTRQTDARGCITYLFYDGLSRLTTKQLRKTSGSICTTTVGDDYEVSYGYDAGHSSSNRSRGQLTSVSNGSHTKWLYYNSYGLLSQETISIYGAPQNYTTAYSYDSYLRPMHTIYPDGELLTVAYNSMGLPNRLQSSWYGYLVDGTTASGGISNGVSYDEAGRLRNMRFPAGGNLWQSHYYRPWTGTDGNSNGRYWGMHVGATAGANNLLGTSLGYDSFGNVSYAQVSQNGVLVDNASFTYDAQNRLTAGYGRTYSYDSAGRLTNYEGVSFNTVVRSHMTLPSSYGYSFDNNGNLTYRPGGWSLTWDHENRLATAARSSPALSESYGYDADGIRIRKTSNGTSTFYPNQFYEQSGALVIKYYYFNGQRIAQRNNGTLYYLHNDHLGGMAFSTSSSGNATLGYYAYGRRRAWSGSIPTRHQFTGQYIDDTSLYYMNARYYDPEIGQFISPDTLVPDPSNLFDYNRYAYARLNPMKYTDPTGHQAECMAMGAFPPAALGCQIGQLAMRYGPTIMQLTVQWADKLPAVDWLFSSNTAEQGAHSTGQQNAGNSASSDPGDPWNRFRKPEIVDKDLVDQLQKEGIKHNPNNILRIGQVPNGRIVFLETGNNTAGLQHIVKTHGSDFANRGVSVEQIPDLVMKALLDNNIVGSQGAGRPIYETIFNGTKQLVAITVGNNGYIVGANPASLP